MRKYQSITRHGKSGTHLTIETNDEIIIQEKLDGANASFKLEDGKVVAFSRNTKLDMSNGLRGFYQWTQTLDPSKLLEGVVYFGEWLVKHKLSYGENENQFYLFDIFNENIEEYVSFQMVEDESERLGLNLIPIFYKGVTLPFEEIEKYAGKSMLGDVGEGVVVKNYNYRDKYNNQVFTKIVTKEFQEKAGVKNPKVATANKDSFDQFLDTYMTKPRVEKILHKMVDEQILEEDYAIEDMGLILKNAGSRVYDDLIKEELDSLLKQLRAKVGKRLPVVIKEILVEQNRA
ncbi:RNA ligase family protein [Alkalihalophilus pseudofirmus]|uniref:RNA ligase family protein n=1 Tax=Alkalihalophilus pseudofirmus TaxID=79885 RepID=UPI00259B114D|nr:RNA ligase family protein [Alkalihalophilus pseudofirmus]WEG18607.1 RNA ligase family protein [Alkalihalophilus pseudofirmus]